MNGFGSISVEFVDWVESLELQDLPLLGSNFTFFEDGSECTRSRLDRFLIKDEVFGWSNRVGQKVFKFSSNQLLIVLSLELEYSSPLPFRFFHIWGEHPDLNNVVKEDLARSKDSSVV